MFRLTRRRAEIAELVSEVMAALAGRGLALLVGRFCGLLLFTGVSGFQVVSINVIHQPPSAL